MKVVCVKFSVLLCALLILGCKPPATADGGNNSSASAQSTDQTTTNPANSSPASSTAMRNEPMQVGTISLKPTKLLDGKFEILIPEGFELMNEQMLVTKYPGENRPTVVYTNPEGTVNVAINHTANKIAPSQLRQMHQQLDTSIRQSQPKAQWMFSGFQHYHGREWTQLEFSSQAIDTKIHNMMLATSADNRMLVVSFNTIDELAADWLPAGREIIKSVYYGQ